MAEEEAPLFYNFFGSATIQNDTSDNQQHRGATENIKRSSSVIEGTENILGTSVFDESRAASDSDSRALSPRPLQTDMEAVDGLRLYKKPKIEGSLENKKGLKEAAMDDLSLTMQPPRLPSSNLHQSVTTQLDFSSAVSKHWDGNAPSAGMVGPGRVSQKGIFADHTAIYSLKDGTAAPLPNIPPADEGSRTGLKGSSVGTLLNRAMASRPGLSLGQSKSSRGLGSESTFLGSQETQPITRQLTIFYGGQAHVYEDVSVQKAEAIMALAGSTGRSWSSVYSPRPKLCAPLSVTEGLMHDRDAIKGANKPSSAHYLDITSGRLTAEVCNAMGSVLQKDHGQTGDFRIQEQSSQVVKRVTDMQIVADHIGANKPESKTHVSAMKATDIEKEHNY